MADRNMRNLGIGIEGRAHFRTRRQRQQFLFELHHAPADRFENFAEPQSVESVDDHEHLGARRDAGMEQGLAGVGGTALQRHAFVRFCAIGNL